MVRLLIVALQGFGILLYSIVELQRPGDENSDWLVQCKQSKHGLISENYHHVPCSMQQPLLYGLRVIRVITRSTQISRLYREAQWLSHTQYHYYTGRLCRYVILAVIIYLRAPLPIPSSRRICIRGRALRMMNRRAADRMIDMQLRLSYNLYNLLCIYIWLWDHWIHISQCGSAIQRVYDMKFKKIITIAIHSL